ADTIFHTLRPIRWHRNPGALRRRSQPCRTQRNVCHCRRQPGHPLRYGQYSNAEGLPVRDLTNFDAVIYLGIDDNTEVPTALIQDVHATDTPVLWVGENSDALAGNDATTFTETYGWDPTDALEVDGGAIKEIGYDGATLDRYQDPAGNKTIATPHI